MLSTSAQGMHSALRDVVLCTGVLLFQVAGQPEPINEETRVMEIFISGDACISIYTHLCPSDNTRPMALDILWQVRRLMLTDARD